VGCPETGGRLFFWIKACTGADDIMGMSYRNKRSAFTLFEAMLAVAVLGMAAAGVLLPFSSGAAVESEGIHHRVATELAANLMEQIASKPFHDPVAANDYRLGPEAGETSPASFDNIDDFDGYTEAQGQILDSAGNLLTDAQYALFSRSVSCSYGYLPQQSNSNAPYAFIRVTVTVSYSGREMAKLTRLFSE
jgi:hypothetical protein